MKADKDRWWLIAEKALAHLIVHIVGQVPMFIFGLGQKRSLLDLYLRFRVGASECRLALGLICWKQTRERLELELQVGFVWVRFRVEDEYNGSTLGKGSGKG